MQGLIMRFAEMINECNNIVFFGGVGVSTESGLKDYRSESGIYNTVKEYGISPEVILSRTFFTQNPEIFYEFFRKYFIVNAEPNNAHKALAKLEEIGKLKSVITQNIDELHQRAGCKNVIELHGTANDFECHYCGCKPRTERTIEAIKTGHVPRCKRCHVVLKPKVVLYEEMLYDGVTEKAISEISRADMLVVGGTSLAVYPAASFVKYFKGRYLTKEKPSMTEMLI